MSEFQINRSTGKSVAFKPDGFFSNFVFSNLYSVIKVPNISYSKSEQFDKQGIFNFSLLSKFEQFLVFKVNKAIILGHNRFLSMITINKIEEEDTLE